MTFLGRMVRYLIWALVAWWAVRLLRRVLHRTGQTANDSAGWVDPEPIGRKLVRDPVCGMHIAEGLAVALRQGDETLYFCSADCRDTYPGFAASA